MLGRRMLPAWLAVLCACALTAQAPPAQLAAAAGERLVYVVSVTRHGVRSPTGKAGQLQRFASGSLPQWPVAPGLLTPHGYHLLQLLGTYERQRLIGLGLFPNADCAENRRYVTIHADSDERTRESANALAKGLLQGCTVHPTALAEGTNDPLFHLAPASITPAMRTLAAAAIAGRIGGDPSEVTRAYATQLARLDALLAGCGRVSGKPATRTSILDVPSALVTDDGSDHLADMRGPLFTGATLTENLLLEYTEGPPAQPAGWGCIHGENLRDLIGLHTAATDLTQRTPAIAVPQARPLLREVSASLEQAVRQQAVAGAIGVSSDRVLLLVGHDTNLINIAGALNLTWISDGRRDDTPPGSMLSFELWKEQASATYAVRLFFTAQTLEQMRESTDLTAQQPPSRVPVFIPGCSRVDLSCDWESFRRLLRRAESITAVGTTAAGTADRCALP